MRDIRILQAIDSWLEELPRRHVDCLTTICSSLYNRALQCGVSEDRLMMVREGADINGPMLSRSEARSKLGLGYSTLLVVSMADQDQSIVREAMLVAKKLRPDSCLVLPGKPSQVGASTENILTPGRVSDEELHLWLCAADCAWLSLARSPLNEGRLPHKVGHYRIYGLPLITTDVSDAPRLGDSGICVVENTAEGFARSLENRAPLDVERRESLRAEGMRHFDWSTILEPLGERISRAIEK